MVEGRQTCIFSVESWAQSPVGQGSREQRDSIVGSGLGPKIVHCTHVDGSKLFLGQNLNSLVHAFQDTQPVVEIPTSC